MTDRPRRGRGRRPAAEVRKEILDAAAELLFAEGMGGFTIEKVANLSGASKMTIYKWWPPKAPSRSTAISTGSTPNWFSQTPATSKATCARSCIRSCESSATVRRAR